jgi:hypothetical protein
MSKICTMFLSILFIFSLSAFGQTGQDKVQKTIDYKAQLQSLETETQMKIGTLNDQIEKADASTREDLDKQIVTLKHDAETQRLTILLNWATSEGNQARIAEVQKALDNWVNPPQPQPQQLIDRSQDTPGSQSSTDQNTKSTSSK